MRLKGQTVLGDVPTSVSTTAITLSRAAEIDALLPQTQCGKCGYAGCRPYAEAVAAGGADINRCPPGGAGLIAEVAALLGVAPKPLDPACGRAGPPRVALIREEHCIGCTLCIQACPVDAIVGAAKLMHTVLDDRCTGCELCLPVCPVDCIVMQASEHTWTRDDAIRAREHFVVRNARLLARSTAARTGATQGDTARAKRRAAIAAALERARARRARGARSAS